MLKPVSDTIRNMRFPLIVMVVMLHTFIIDEPMMGRVYVPSGRYPMFDVSVYALKACFGEVAIPLFFVISGYLFFAGVERLVVSTYREKLRKRVWSLLVPYLCWNTLFIFYVFLVQQIVPELASSKMRVADFSLIDWGLAYWELSNGLIPLWYIRDLMVISLFTPIIYVAIRRYGLLLPIVLGVLYLTNSFKYIPGLGTRCSFLFVLGAYFSIRNINFFALANRHFTILAFSYAVLVFADTYCWHFGINCGSLNQLTLLIGVFALSGFFYRLTTQRRLRLPGLLVEASFFVFVFHMFIIYIPGRFWPAILPVNIVTAFIMQILIPILVSLGCVAVYVVLKKIVPTLTLVFNGSR